MKKLIALLPIIALMTGCSLMGTSPSAPSKFEQSLFNVQTNWTTNSVWTTNIIPQVVTQQVWHTNTIGLLDIQTNTYTIFTTNVAFVTNTIPQYVMTTSDSTKTLVSGTGTLINTFFPGGGGAVTAGILALLAAWGHLRSSKNGDTAAALAQEVETMREFIKTLPSGTKYDVAITQFLQDHQVESGVAKQVLSLLSDRVDNPEAKVAMSEIKNTLAALSGPG